MKHPEVRGKGVLEQFTFEARALARRAWLGMKQGLPRCFWRASGVLLPKRRRDVRGAGACLRAQKSTASSSTLSGGACLSCT